MSPSHGVTAALQVLQAAGVTHVLGVPDNASAPLYDALGAGGPIRLVPVTREGEAFAMASGLWLGGARPLVVVQNTGLLESGDALRGTAVRMGAPIPFVVTGRGYPRMEAAGLGPATPRTPHLLTRPDVDSVALVTEPTLEAWGIPYTVCRSGADFPAALAGLLSEVERLGHPTALLLTASVA